MAHFAQLNEDGVVVQVIVVNNDVLESTKATNTDGEYINVVTTQSEESGIAFCKSLYGQDTVWKQTSYNGSFRGKYATIGDTFDGVNFVAPVVEVAPDVVEPEPQVQLSVSVQDTTSVVEVSPTATVYATDLPSIDASQP